MGFYYGVGVNDSEEPVTTVKNGKQIRKPEYLVWNSMLRRCYSDQYHKTHGAYEECRVCNDWLKFSNFKAWMETQDWKGKQLDKDVIRPGNKIYCPEYCVFVSPEVNGLLKKRSRPGSNKYMTGVVFNRSRGKYEAQISINNRQKLIGRFDTPEEAHKAYLEAKHRRILEVAARQDDPRVRNGLELHAELFRR